MFLENQGFAKMRVRLIPPSPPDKSFIFNYLPPVLLIILPGSKHQTIANKNIYHSLMAESVTLLPCLRW
jgi:hypothetical protein